MCSLHLQYCTCQGTFNASPEAVPVRQALGLIAGISVHAKVLLCLRRANDSFRAVSIAAFKGTGRLVMAALHSTLTTLPNAEWPFGTYCHRVVAAVPKRMRGVSALCRGNLAASLDDLRLPYRDLASWCAPAAWACPAREDMADNRV